METPFRGFSEATLAFLSTLSAHNNREWFMENKADYQRHVVAPALGFIEHMGTHLAQISPHFSAIAKQNGGSLMRIYRDTRFSRDKTPYKTNIGIQFRHTLGKDVHAPGFYFHLEAHEAFLGVGIWHPQSAPLQQIRHWISENPRSWIAARDGVAFRKHYQLEGDTLKRAPKGYPSDHPLIGDLKRKDFIAISDLPPEALLGPEALELVAQQFHAGRLFMDTLCTALEVPF